MYLFQAAYMPPLFAYRKVLFIVKGDLIYDWESKWLIPFTSLRSDPQCNQNVVTFKLHAIVSRQFCTLSHYFMFWFPLTESNGVLNLKNRVYLATK